MAAAMPKSERIGLYPGTFDPITHGHMDIIRRAAHMVDWLIIGVAKNAGKSPLFSPVERVKMVQREVKKLHNTNIKVKPFDGLLVKTAQEMGASVLIRGLRGIGDFEYEMQMAAINRQLYPEVETIFLMACEGTQFVASRHVKEIASLGGKVIAFVSEDTAADLARRYSPKKPRGGAKSRGPQLI